MSKAVTGSQFLHLLHLLDCRAEPGLPEESISGDREFTATKCAVREEKDNDERGHCQTQPQHAPTLAWAHGNILSCAQYASTLVGGLHSLGEIFVAKPRSTIAPLFAFDSFSAPPREAAGSWIQGQIESGLQLEITG